MREACPHPAAGAGLQSKRLFVVCLAACLLTAGVAWWVMRAVDAPWSGRTGNLIFRGQADAGGTLDHWRGVLKFYFDGSHPRRSKLDLDQWISVGLWTGSLVVLGASLLAGATSWWWSRWIRHPEAAGERAPRERVPRWSVAVLVVALVVGAILRIQTISDPPFWDEQDNMTRNFHGYVEYASPQAAPVWVPAGFKGALWENVRGNNPYLYSLLSQMSQKIWRLWTGAPAERFSIVAIRMPAVISGILAIAALWWALNRMGLVRAAPWAALLLAIHGLAIEFSVEARGHGLNLFCSALLLGIAWSALQGGRARTWWAYGFLLVCSLLSHPASLYNVVCLNLYVAAVLLWKGWKQGDAMARCGFARWVLANTVAALAYLWILAPAMPQAALSFSSKFPTGDMGLAWHTGAFMAYATGLCASTFTGDFGAVFELGMPEAAMHGWTAFTWLFGGFRHCLPLALWAVGLFPVLLVAGWWRIHRSGAGPVCAGLLAASLLSGPLMVLIQPNLTKGVVIFFWYVIFILPAAVALAANGLTAVGDWVASRLGIERRRDMVVAAVGASAMLWLFAISSSVIPAEPWKSGYARFIRKPFHHPWRGEPGLIPSDAFTRGRHHRWISYQDGYLVVCSGYHKDPAAWQAVVSRPLASWGRLPEGPATTPSAPAVP